MRLPGSDPRTNPSWGPAHRNLFPSGNVTQQDRRENLQAELIASGMESQSRCTCSESEFEYDGVVARNYRRVAVSVISNRPY